MQSFKLPKGIFVKEIKDVRECYTISKLEKNYRIIISVSAENINNLFMALSKNIWEPGFLIFEHGTNQKIEKTLRTSDHDPFHKDIYYIDGLDNSKFTNIYTKYNELLVNDGMINFGYGSHENHEQIFIGLYKVFYIHCQDYKKYIDVIEKFNIPESSKIETIWDCFSKDNPGNKKTIKHNGIGIYDMIEELKDHGLYFAERIEA